MHAVIRTKLLTNERGTTAVEYAFVAVLISVACIGGYAALGAEMKAKWQTVWDASRDAKGY